MATESNRPLSDLMIVPDAPAGAACGCVVFWRLQGSADMVALVDRWTHEGLDAAELPEMPSPDKALHRAAAELRTAHRMVRRIPAGKGWAIVDERTDPETSLTYRVDGVCSIDKVGRPVMEPADHPSAGAFVDAYVRHLDQVSQSDVGVWLVEMVRSCDAIALRDTGGVYYVPPAKVERWHRICAAVGAATQHVLREIPAMRTEETVKAVLDSIAAEATAEAQQLEDDLGNDELGHRALRTRARRATAMAKKVERYEALLGERIGQLREELERLHGNLVVAAIAAEQGAEAERGAA